MSAILCVDAGTSVIKSVVFSADGRELTVSRRPTRVSRPESGRVEQDMADVLGAVLTTMREAVAASSEPVTSIAITAQGDGFWPVGADERPAGDAILWNDGRADGVLAAWEADGTLERVFRINGSLGNKGLPNAIMRHQLDRGPGLDGVDCVLTCGSWIFLALTGVRGLHFSEASAPWLDVHTGGGSGMLLELYGLQDYATLVPRVLEGDELVQPLRRDIALSAGLEPNTPVVLAPYDVVATALGSGAVDVADAFCILGTTLCAGVIEAHADTTGEPGGLTLLTGHGPSVVRAFPTLAGTGVVDWTAQLLGLPDAAALTELASQSPPGANGVIIWPYLSGVGERAPFLDRSARGTIGGLHFAHSRADIARACLEGLAYVIKECASAASTSSTALAMSGGGSGNSFWCQIVADVTGVPALRPADSQVGAKGAMIAAAVSRGLYADADEAARHLVRHTRVFEPDASVAPLYADRFETFTRTRTSMSLYAKDPEQPPR
ncbi:FGGY family carbohydrate kinase [Microbacterium sp. P01]|uniref:FGGY family carbohydrate kinase n=1 Tax=Microbacterium sp. P01 TaxID=3366261 RepID=UPI00366F4006